ncbi:hypothetical protein [Kocuria rosea]|uniref:hypothetical protein n=1 Tax=Kocuria rosea TaxID=1275 RepID=UPI003D33F0EC
MTKKTVYHPTLPGVTREVPEDAVKSWRDSGWTVSKPRAWDGAEPAQDPTAGAAESTT